MVRFFADKFLFSQKIINRMYNVLVDDTLSYSKTIQKLVLSLDESESFLVEVGPPTNYCATFVNLFDNNVFPFLLEFLVPTLFRRKVEKFDVTIEFKFFVTTFFDEQIKRCELALQGSP